MRPNHKWAALVSVVLISLVALPATAGAAKSKSKPKLSKLERTQNRKLASDRIALTGASTAITGLANKLAGLTAGLGTTNTTVGSLDTRLTDTTNKLNALAGAAATLPGILTQLGNGLTAAGAGLTQVGAGLTTLQHVTTSQTHIAAQVFAGTPSAATAVQGCFVTTPPLPFDGNQALASMSCPVVQIQTDPSGGGENAPAAGGPLTVLADCRSNKTNITGASAPCGLGGIVSLTVNESPATGYAGSLPAPSGFLATKPNAALGGGPLVSFDRVTPIPDLTGAGGTNNPSAPLSFTSNDTAANQINLTDTSGGGSATDFPPGTPPSLPNCTGGATPCVSTINITIRGVDSNPETG